MDDEIKTGEMTGEIDESITVEEDFTLLEGKAVSINDDSDNKTKEEEVYEEALDVKESLDDIRQQIKDKLLGILEKGKITDADSCEIELLNDQYNEKYNELKDIANTVIPGGKGTSIENASTTDNSTTEIVKVNIDYDEILKTINEKADWLYIDEDGQVMLNGEVVPKLKVIELEAEKIKADVGEFKDLTTENFKATNAEITNLKADYGDFKNLTAENFTATNARIENLAANKADIEYLTANYATIEKLNATNAEITNLKSDYGEFKNLTAENFTAVNADIDNLTANKADVDYLTSNYATINMLNTNVASINTALIDKANVSDLNATNALVEDLRASKADVADLTAVNAKITNLEAGKADVAVLEANYATIKQLDATNANVTSLQTETANINKALIDKANVVDLNATNAKVTDLQATKADVSDLNAAKANISTLTSDLAEVTTLVNGNLTSDNIQSMVITGEKFTVADAFIKNAMIDSVNANKINAGIINTNNVSIQSNDGSMVLKGNLQQFKDKNGKVRIQIGKDATGNFTFVLYDENGTGQLINQNGIQSSNAIADGLIVDSKVADNANIAGSKLDIDSVVTEVNNGSTSIKGTKIYLDDQSQSLDVAFNNMTTTVNGNTSTLNSHTTSINTMNGKITQLISDTTITKQDGTTTSLKDAYNATVDTVNSHTQTIGSLETNLSKVSTGQNKWLLEMFEKGDGIDDISPITINDIMGKPLRRAILVDDSVTSNQSQFDNYYLGRATTYVYLDEDYNWETTATSDDGSTIYINGAAIATLTSCAPTAITVPFKQGWNKITWVYNEGIGGDGWDFNPRLTTLPQIKYMNAYPTTNIDEVGNVLDSNIKTVSSKQATLEQNLDGFKQTVSNTYTTKADFNGLKIGGTNLLTKDDNNLTKWSKVGNTAPIKVTNNNYDNEITYTNPGSDWEVIYKAVSVSPNTQYTISWDWKVYNNYSFYGNYKYGFEIASTQPGNVATANVIARYDYPNTATGWRRNSITFTPTVSTIYLVFNGGYINDGTGTYKFAANNFKLEIGNKATSWSPSPKDIDASITAVDNKFVNYSTTSQMNSAINQKANEITSTVSETYATKASLTTVDNKFANYSTTSAMNSAINQKANEITSSVSETYATKTSVSDLSNNLTNNYSTTSAMNSAINQKANEITSTVSETYATKTALNTVDGKFANYSTTSDMNSAINQKSDAILSTVSSTYATKTSLNEVDGKFADYSTTSAMNTAINQKADSILSTVNNTYATKESLNSVDGKFANYSTTNDMHSAINQKGDSILSSVSNTYTTKAEFNNLEIGGTNLVLNSSFAKNAYEWNLNLVEWSDVALVDENTSPTRKALKITVNSTAGGYGIWQTITPRKTGNYTLSFYAKADTDNYNIFAGQEGSATKEFVLTTNWAKYTYTYNRAQLDSNAIIFYTRENASNGAFYIHSVKLEYGNKATDWTPAPEDINASITAVDNKFVNYATINQMNSSIDQKANEINLNVSNTYATKTSVTDLNNNLSNNYSTTQQMNSAIDIAKSSIKLDVSNNYASKHEVAHYFEGENKWKLDLYSLGSMSGASTPTKELIVQSNCQYQSSILVEHPSYEGDKYGDNYVGYATTYMHFTEDYQWNGRVVTDDNGNVYLNDVLVLSTPTCQWVDITLNFKAGWNKLEVLYAEGIGGDGWQFDSEIVVVPGGVLDKMNCYGQNSTEEYLKANYSTTEQMNSAINIAKDSITSTVSQTYSTKAETDNKINNVKIGGTNLFRGTANLDSPYWIGENAFLTDSYYRGSRIYRVSYAWADYNYPVRYLFEDDVIELNTEYTFSCYARTNNDGYRPNLCIYGDSAHMEGHGLYIGTVTTAWRQYSGKIKFYNGDRSYPLRIEPTTSSDDNNIYIEVCGLQLEKGNKATDWSPAPADIDASITAVDSKFTNYSTTSQMNSAINQKANEITSSVSNTYATKAALNTVDGKFANYSTTTAMNTAINQKADSITQSVSNTYATKTDLNTANGNISSLTNRMQSAESKLTKDSLTTTIGNYYTTSTDVNGIITSKNYATTSQLQQTATDLTATFNDGYNQGITRINKDGIKVTQSGISGYSQMNANGFYIHKGSEDIFKVDSNGLYVKGNGEFTGKITSTSGAIGGYTISDYIIKGTNVGMSSLSGHDWAFWAGASTGGSAPFRVGHDGSLTATQATITGTITGSIINGGVINGSTINSDSFVGDVLAIDGTISAKSLQVQDIDNAKYPATLDGNLELYVNSESGNDDNEPDDDVRFKTLQGAIDAIPKFLNGKTVYITMETDSTEDVYMRGFVGGAIRIYMNGKTLYGTLRSYVCAASITVYGGTKDSTEGATGVIHPNVGLSFGTRAVSVGFEASQYAALYKIKVYAPDNIPSDISNTDKVCVASQAGTGSVYCKNIQIVNAVIGFRTNNHGSMHVNSSSGVASKYGFQAATGGIISLANNNQAGGKTANTNKNSGGQVWYDSNGPKFATGNQTTDGGTAPVAPTTKTLTIKSSYGDTYRSTVYNSWKRDGSVRGGDYGYGDCNGCWFFGSAFSEVKGKTISKVEITITRNSGGKSSAVGLVVKSHGYSGRPSGAPTYRTTAGTLSLATGATGKLTITNSTILNEIKSGTVKGFGIQNTYNSDNYAVCSGSCTVKITYTE